jgi:ferredoxin
LDYEKAGYFMKINIDRSKCEGYAKCIQASPKVFKLDNTMIAEVIDAKGDSDERILLAAKICPTKAITLNEEETGKKLYPPD